MYAAAPRAGFLDSISAAFGKYVDIGGRAARREYWFFMLFLLLANIATLVLDLGIWRSVDFTPFNALFAFLTVVPSFTAAIRRLHDTGRSGWWLLILLVPLVGAVLFIYWLCQRGDQATNTYGPPAG